MTGGNPIHSYLPPLRTHLYRAATCQVSWKPGPAAGFKASLSTACQMGTDWWPGHSTSESRGKNPKEGNVTQYNRNQGSTPKKHLVSFQNLEEGRSPTRSEEPACPGRAYLGSSSSVCRLRTTRRCRQREARPFNWTVSYRILILTDDWKINHETREEGQDTAIVFLQTFNKCRDTSV